MCQAPSSLLLNITSPPKTEFQLKSKPERKWYVMYDVAQWWPNSKWSSNGKILNTRRLLKSKFFLFDSSLWYWPKEDPFIFAKCSSVTATSSSWWHSLWNFLVWQPPHYVKMDILNTYQKTAHQNCYLIIRKSFLESHMWSVKIV